MEREKMDGYDELEQFGAGHSGIKRKPAATIESLKWNPIETAPKGVKVLAGYWNECGKWRTIMACYYLAGTLDSSEWNESEDGYADEGWYEESETQEMLLPPDCPPTHWQPLPSSPTTQPKSGAW